MPDHVLKNLPDGIFYIDNDDEEFDGNDVTAEQKRRFTSIIDSQNEID